MRITLLLWMILITMNGVLFAQENDTTFSQDSVVYLSPQEYALMLDREDRFLIRASLISAGIEWEFAKNFSLRGQLGTTEDTYEGSFGIIEFRSYLNFKSIVNSNLSGLYAAAGYKVYDRGGNRSYLSISEQFDANQVYLQLGFQRRFLGNGLADFGLRFAHERWESDWAGEQESFIIESKMAIGLGIALKKYEDLDYERLCPVLKCYDSERFLLKINFADAIRLESNGNRFTMEFNPSIAMEYKFGDSPFSSQLRMGLVGSQSFLEDANFNTFSSYTARIDLESRYYYNLNRRIRTGKTGNSLSANYIALGYLATEQFIYSDNSRANNSFVTGGLFLSTGVQRTFGKRLYFDVYLSLGNFQTWGSDLYDLTPYGGVECGIKF